VMATAHLVMEQDYNQYQFETYVVLAVIYALLCLIAWLIVRFFELRSSKFTPKAVPAKTIIMASV
jgi:L-cystine transport system permease protein